VENTRGVTTLDQGINLTIFYSNIQIISNKGPADNRSVYAIGSPHRENLLAKEYGLVVGGAACPSSRRGLPLGVTVFANARITKQNQNPASHHECKNTRHRDSAPTAHTAERYHTFINH